MQSNSYQFQTQWRVEATAEEIYDLISHPLDFPRWWPAVYLHVEEIRPADKDGLGGCVRLHTKGWLPYTLTWESCCTFRRNGRVDHPAGRPPCERHL